MHCVNWIDDINPLSGYDLVIWYDVDVIPT